MRTKNEEREQEQEHEQEHVYVLVLGGPWARRSLVWAGTRPRVLVHGLGLAHVLVLVSRRASLVGPSPCSSVLLVR